MRENNVDLFTVVTNENFFFFHLVVTAGNNTLFQTLNVTSTKMDNSKGLDKVF